MESQKEEDKAGKQNRDRFHWQERDLADWVKKWLEMNIDNTVLVDSDEYIIRCREAYREDGECILQSRKGTLFVVYGLDLIIKWYAQRRLGDRVLGEARGRVRLSHFCSTQGENEEYIVQGDWQYKRSMHQDSNIKELQPPAQADSTVSEIEIAIRDDISALFLPALKQRIQHLRTSLDGMAATMQKNQVVTLPDPQLLPTIDHGPTKRAEATTRAFVQNLKAQMRSPNFESRLKEIIDGARSDGDFRSMCLTDVDIPAIVSALPSKNSSTPTNENDNQKGKSLTSLDLSYNEITDTGLQPLLCALAMGSAPDLHTLRLDQTKVSDLAGKQLAGLSTMRKHLTIHHAPPQSSS